MCKVVVSLASDYLILHPEDISDWRSHHPAGRCQACSNLSDTAFKSAAKKAQRARATALGGHGGTVPASWTGALEARIMELHEGATKADARRLVFARINLFLASWAAAISKEDSELKEVRAKIYDMSVQEFDHAADHPDEPGTYGMSIKLTEEQAAHVTQIANVIVIGFCCRNPECLYLGTTPCVWSIRMAATTCAPCA